MKPRLIIEQSAIDLGVGNACALVIQGIKVVSDQSFSALLTENLNRVGEQLSALTSSSVYNGFALQLQQMGYPHTVSANEKILKNFISRGVRSINNVVDAYNAVAIRHGVSIGVHDYHHADDIRVFRTPQPFAFRPLFAKKDIAVPTGDLVYACGEKVLACIGKTDADAHDFRLTEKTSTLVAIVLGHQHTSMAFNRAVLEELQAVLGQRLPGLSHYFLEREVATG